uniref:Putative secreted protein n=1 Tax=Ixodes ricinus TaxID=34613 RepID=V5GKP1_IXORI
MQLVVFAVVLILPSFLSGESSMTITEVSNECEGAIVQGGDFECYRQGSYYKGYDPEICAVICGDAEGPKLPDGVCSNHQVKNCDPEVLKKLKDWESDIQKK